VGLIDTHSGAPERILVAVGSHWRTMARPIVPRGDHAMVWAYVQLRRLGLGHQSCSWVRGIHCAGYVSVELEWKLPAWSRPAAPPAHVESTLPVGGGGGKRPLDPEAAYELCSVPGGHGI